MKVLKFGGTSVANSKNIPLALNIIQSQAIISPIVIVVSALGGVTDLLVAAAKKASSKEEDYLEILIEIENKHKITIMELFSANNQLEMLQNIELNCKKLKTLLDGCYLLGELSDRSSDSILSFGELLSSQIITKALQQNGIDATYKNSQELIKTNNQFGNATVNFEITNSLIHTYFEENKNTIFVFPGFIASSLDGNNTTLGRGGSDYTAAILAAAIGASQLEIWTDVSGMFTANPRIVKQAQPIDKISYQEAMELSHFGAKVIYPPTIQPVLKLNIPIWIKNTFDPSANGTYISNQLEQNASPVKGISHIDNIALLTIEGSGIVGVSGSSKRLFEVLYTQNINAVFITQASSEHSICIGILNTEADRAQIAINQIFETEISQNKIEPCIVEKDLCIIALVGEKMKNHQGLSGKMFSTLGQNNVNVRAIAQGASERNISAVILEKDVKKALNALHERFFEDNTKQLNLFVIGVGNVGEIFLKQINQQHEYLKNNLKINIRVIAISNSRKMHFNPEGIDLENWKANLENAETTNLQQFISKASSLNLRNSIFVDNTANENIASIYDQFLKQNIAIVTCNKIACSSSYENYKNLKNLSRKYNAPFLFETNVGAGLPIIDTLKNLIASGDRVTQIQAVLSGSLNFIFNNFDANNSFHDVVQEAGIQGYTEPDPKIDLSGVDVARKILILIRESGYPMEMEDIENNSFLPKECMETTNNKDFFDSLLQNAEHFNKLLNEANTKKSRLKFVATFQNGKANVGLQFIPQESPFYNLEGKDNIVQFYTERYSDQPLIIKGAGAGAAVTASGIFSDVIRVGNN